MARVRKIQPLRNPMPVVSFDFENRTYQIDPNLRKVYRRFVEIETSKASTILQVWRSQVATA